MKHISNDILQQFLSAIDKHRHIARELINKLTTETNQPHKDAIALGRYSYLQNAELLNGQPYLSGNWMFDVHGEHCLFESINTGQKLEVSLSDDDGSENLDPYFFYQFLKTTGPLTYLTTYLQHPFKDTYDFFEELERNKILIRIAGAQFRRVVST